MTEMHDVVEMLLTRIKDYPEDFVAEPSSSRYQIEVDNPWTKWNEALRIVRAVTTDEELQALDAALIEAKRAIYMGAALKTMMSADEPEKEIGPKATPYNLNTLGTSGIFGSMPLLATNGASQSHAAQQAQIDYIKAKQELAQAQAANKLGLFK